MSRTLLTGTILRSGSIPTSALGGGVVSSSLQIISALPSGTLSSSVQVNYTQLQNIPEGIVSESSQVQLAHISGNTFGNTNFTFPQAVTASTLLVTDTAFVRELSTLYVTSSVIYESGSTKFGDSPDDTHQFTGSILLSEGAFMNPSTLTADITIPAGYNGLLVGPITNTETITVEETATLTIV